MIVFINNELEFTAAAAAGQAALAAVSLLSASGS